MEDLGGLLRAKHKLLGTEGVLSMELETARFSDVAGLAHLKRWLEQRKAAFLGDAAAMGLDTPKGIMLLGVQGGGKSLAAKAVAGAWGVALMRLDFAAVYNKWLGETERNLRDALKNAEAMAPCVLWIDEIEKGIATGDGDGGESRRILGTLLTWMAERKSKVFMVATANDIERLPPELVRKGRLDEIFFVDLPDDVTRAEIFGLHLAKRKQDPAKFDLAKLAVDADGFSGAEIEQAIVSALYEGYARKQSLSTAIIAEELARTRPLSVVMAEKVAYLRAWAAERTVPAG
jgi:SpoVK/Ycf46/Vps4 family AAA+-type ATPase